MGDPKRARKKYESARKEWSTERIEKEGKVVEFYGLKNNREIRKLETLLSRKRENARKLLAMDIAKRAEKEKELMQSLNTIGLLKEGSNLEDVLGLSLEEIMERRLETIVWRKNLSLTTKQARQFITHGHIAVNGRKVTAPSYIVRNKDNISYYGEPIKLETPKKETKEDVKKKFEEVAKEAEQVLKALEGPKMPERKETEATKTGKE